MTCASDEPPAFEGLSEELLLKSLKTLEAAGKAEIMGEDGVKFF